jgi:ubiquinone/menaquinone biosynthesis C-methylase UbiE
VIVKLAEDLIPDELPRYAKRETFLRTGRQFRDACIELAELQTNSRVLDVGCGVGRLAVALVDYLVDGTYDGTDVARSSIDWCTEHIGNPHTNFSFHLIEAVNQHYAPEHTSSASRVPFPFDDAQFDVVFANSLYTHLLADDTTHYLREMARVLAAGGRMLVSIFLLNDAARAGLITGQSVNGWTLESRVAQAYVEKPENPEAVVAYDESFIRGVLDDLPLSYQIHHGRWSGGHETPHTHFGNKDIIVAERR